MVAEKKNRQIRQCAKQERSDDERSERLQAVCQYTTNFQTLAESMEKREVAEKVASEPEKIFPDKYSFTGRKGIYEYYKNKTQR